MRGSVRVAIPCAPHVATALASVPTRGGESRSRDGTFDLLRPHSSPAKVVKRLLQAKVAGVFFPFPPFPRVVRLSVAFATPLEIPSPCSTHDRPSTCGGCVSSCRKVRLRVPSLRSGSLRSAGARSLLRRDCPADGFQGGSRSHAVPIVPPGGTPARTAPPLAGGLAEERLLATWGARTPLRSVKGVPFPRSASGGVSPLGTTRPRLRLARCPLLNGRPVGAVRSEPDGHPAHRVPSRSTLPWSGRAETMPPQSWRHRCTFVIGASLAVPQRGTA